MSSAAYKKKRRYPRLTLRIDVRHQSPLGDHQHTATTLGAGGLFLQTSSPFEVGTALTVSFSLPGNPGVHTLRGVVVWRREELTDGAPRGVPGVGIRFTDRVAAATLARRLEEFARSVDG